MDSLEELHRANVCRHFRDCLGTTRPKWPTAQRLETAPCCPLPRREGPLDRPPVSCPSEPLLATAPAFVGRCPPGVLRAKQFRVPQTVFDPVNAEAESDDGNGSFLREQVVIGIFTRRRPRAREARCSGLSSPVMMSSSMACPLLPRTLVAMLASFTFASSSTF
jgi:hypothetical protein